MINETSGKDWIKLAKDVGVKLNEEISRKLDRYFDELLKWNRRFNLTGIKIPQDIRVKNFQDSIAVSRLIFDENTPLVDIGSGAGFPGLVVKIIRPALFMYLVEPNNHRYNFLCHVKRLLSLNTLEVYRGSIKKWLDDFRDTRDEDSALFISRAWKKPQQVLSTLGPEMVGMAGSSIILMLGSKGLTELQRLIPTIKSFDLKITGCQRVILTGEKGTRINVLLSR